MSRKAKQTNKRAAADRLAPGSKTISGTDGSSIGEGTSVVEETGDWKVDAESSISLTSKGSLWLLDRIENPPPRNAKFLSAQNWYRREVGFDEPTGE